MEKKIDINIDSIEPTDIYVAIMLELCKDKHISIDLKKKNLSVNGTGWIVGGKKTTACPDLPYWHLQEDTDVMELIEKGYHTYKYSYPSENETRKKNSYFKALTAEEMTDEELVNGADREKSRVMLECTVLFGSLSGMLKWERKWGSWYYQGKSDKDLIILREWIE